MLKFRVILEGFQAFPGAPGKLELEPVCSERYGHSKVRGSCCARPFPWSANTLASLQGIAGPDSFSEVLGLFVDLVSGLKPANEYLPAFDIVREHMTRSVCLSVRPRAAKREFGTD